MSINAVAPLAGAWIEMLKESLMFTLVTVAPLAGAWIEIWHGKEYARIDSCRSTRGSVD